MSELGHRVWFKAGDCRSEVDRLMAKCGGENGGRVVGEPFAVPGVLEDATEGMWLAAAGEWWREQMKVHGEKDGWMIKTLP